MKMPVRPLLFMLCLSVGGLRAQPASPSPLTTLAIVEQTVPGRWIVAEGRADIYPRLAPTSEWDTAAAQGVLEAAGGVLADTAFQPYRYNRKDELLNPHFFAIGDRTFRP